MTEINLLNISAEDLLTKFGAGSHKPGSGSAAAFQGMISAKLLLTVISLTNEKSHRKNYGLSIKRLLEMHSRIQDVIFPELTLLFQEDSVQFEKTIKLRKRRDAEQSPVNKNLLARQALKELKVAIDIPIAIADLCIELSEIAEFVFDNAFKSARGDTQVALSGAVAALAGCMSIIQLNLLSFGSDEYNWTDEVMNKINRSKARHKELNVTANLKIELLEMEVKKLVAFYKQVNDFLDKTRKKTNLTDVEIESSAIELQRLIWKNRGMIWLADIPINPVDVLKPLAIFRKAFGYHCNDSRTLSGADVLLETAGIIDQENKLVLISSDFSPQIKNFTAAHELGHALFHKQTVMHRDIPVDVQGLSLGRAKEELQADKFAAYFLMPRKQVKELFEKTFLTETFYINQNSTFNLTKGDISKLRLECKDLRALSRKLASAETYRDEFFVSMADVFNVSIGAMAIRLEELNLVKY